MEIAFKTKELRKVCEIFEEALDAYGQRVALKMKSRLSDISLVSNYSEIPIGNPRVIESNDESLLVIDLTDGFYFQFSANHHPPIIQQSGKIDWKSVFRVKLIKIGKNDE